MRTIRVTVHQRIDGDQSVDVSTEVIIDDDESAETAGFEARQALDTFAVGYAKGGQL